MSFQVDPLMPRFRAKNDWLIDKLIADPRYDVRESGQVWTLIALNGRAGKTWRVAGKTDKEGYREMPYRGRYLKIHRIVYRKFKGELSAEMVVDHADRDTGNNRPSNLSLVTPQENNEYRYRREQRPKRCRQARPAPEPRTSAPEALAA